MAPLLPVAISRGGGDRGSPRGTRCGLGIGAAVPITSAMGTALCTAPPRDGGAALATWSTREETSWQLTVVPNPLLIPGESDSSVEQARIFRNALFDYQRRITEKTLFKNSMRKAK